MGRAIWKYPLDLKGVQTVEMPEGAEILSVQTQTHSGRVCLWALVSTQVPLSNRRIHIHGTGHPTVMQRGAFVGTVQTPDGFVWHVFDMGEEQRG